MRSFMHAFLVAGEGAERAGLPYDIHAEQDRSQPILTSRIAEPSSCEP